MTGDHDGDYFYTIIAALCWVAYRILILPVYPLMRVTVWLHDTGKWAKDKQLEADKDAAKAREEMDK